MGVKQIPCDHQVRTLLDPIAPSSLEPVFEESCKGLEHHRLCDHFRLRGEHLWVALDGTTSLSSTTLHGPTCLTRPLTHGPTLSSHTALTPVIVCPGRPDVIALPPAYILPQDGEAKQDCAQQAGKRWLSTHAQAVAPHQMTCLGAALSSQPPFCALAQPQGWHCILTCQPAAHPKCYERLAFWQAHDGMAERAGRGWNGRVTAVTRYRDSNDVLLRSGDEAWSVHGCERTVVKAKTGAQRDHNSCITHHRLSADHIAAVAQAGRGRWQSENDNTNVLKTKGDHLEHHFGHGQQDLSALLLSLNLLALLFQTVLA